VHFEEDRNPLDTKGNSQVQTKGFAGSECVEASQFIEQALGKQVSQRTTPEFFSVQNQQNQRLQEGA
jgi:hypothetical protein